ncbi:GntP family permease [Pengzhenrongella sicca]|uniref:Gluconate transporter n=1 Tax=Pengzhenrongella sicca TaxID=2819238 RepID=A0A8A4ZD76_9MICO|nr:gluconate:H+ symporter [Pengzhenrongella sicca]QTE29295.1 gluconate transporter [Pengzhenrongella sicca]
MSTTLSTTLNSTVQAATEALSSAGSTQLIVAALVGIAVIVLLITQLKLHPFLALTVGSITVGALGGMELKDALASYSTGVGATVASVGTLIALGAMFGRLLADSGGADQIADTIINRATPRTLPWAMALVGALIGLPMFFEIGLVLLIPIILVVARRSGLPLMRIGLPALAGLSVMHGLVPPHPGPLVAIAALDANLGVTMALGVLIAIPVVALAGPVLAKYVGRWVPVSAPALFVPAGAPAAVAPMSSATATTTGAGTDATSADATDAGTRRPSFTTTLATVLLPVVLMMGKALVDIFLAEGSSVRAALDFLGTPLIALLLAVFVAMFTFGRGSGMKLGEIATSIEKSLPPIAGILLIVAAGGGFKQTLVDTGIGGVLADAIAGSSVSPLLLAWVVAVLIRLATGSATVATVTASGILAPLALTLSTGETSLLVLAIGSGSLFFSHVNDAGFWLVKEYFGLSVGETIKSWSVMETVISVAGLLLVMVLGIFI